MVGFNSNNFYNISFKSTITDKEIDSMKNAKQHFSDCYLMCTLESLSNTDNGRKILKESIQRDDKNPSLINCYLHTPSGEKKGYSIPTTTVLKGYEKVYKHQPNEIIRSMDISVNEFEKKYKTKYFISDIRDTFNDYKFEYNLPSRFMKTLTGVKPRVIGETNCNINLNKYKDEVMELLKQIEKEEKSSFVLSTGIKGIDGHRWHVYILEKVDLKNNTITVKEKRGNNPQVLTIDEALNKFKCIVGYFNSDLEKKASSSTV